AVAELRRATIVVGLDQYLRQVQDLIRPGTTIRSSGLGQEQERAETAAAAAAAGHAVALIGLGDAGVYAMGSPALETAGVDIEVVGVPGVTAALAAAAVPGAPPRPRPPPAHVPPARPAPPVGRQRARGARRGRRRPGGVLLQPRQPGT